MSEEKHKELTPITTPDFITDAYKIYGTYVLEDRAVSDFRDGLKPVQRAIMWDMFRDEKCLPGLPFKKAAKVVGSVLGGYHPHGDSAAYGAMVNMVQARYPLIEGHGNWGSYTSPAAAYRYTECRLSKMAMKMFECCEIAAMHPNYSDDKQWPIVLNGRLPLLLMNGTEGIAVGLAACIPPHNLGELIEACKLIVNEKEDSPATLDDLLQHIKGPDYECGGVITSSKDEIKQVYETGHGTLRFQCLYKIEDNGSDGKLFVLTGFAPRFNVESFLAHCTEYAQEGLLESNPVDETDENNGIRITVGFKNPHVVKQTILPMLNTSVSYHFYVTERKDTSVQVRYMNLEKLLRDWISYRYTVEEEMLKLEERKLKARLDREEAKLIAINNIDKIADILKKAKDDEDAFTLLEKELKVSRKGAEYIWDLKLSALKKANSTDQAKVIADVKAAISAVQLKLTNMDQVLLDRLEELKEFADERRMKVGGVKDKLSKIEAVNSIVLVSEEGSIEHSTEINTRARKWDYKYACATSQGITLVTRECKVGQWDMGNLSSGKSGYENIVGILPFEKTKLVMLDNEGMMGIVEHPNNSYEFKGFRTEAPIVQAVGLEEGDSLIMWRCGTKYNKPYIDFIYIYEYDDLGTKQKNTGGQRCIPSIQLATGKHGMLLVPKGCEIVVYSEDEKTIGKIDMDKIKDSEAFAKNVPNGRVLIMGNNNFVVQNGKRSTMTSKAILHEMKNAGGSPEEFQLIMPIADEKKEEE